MKRLISSLAALVAVACLVSACGQKGPLYLPDDGKDRKDAHSSHQHQTKAKPAQTEEQQDTLQSEPEQSPEQ
nr:lipoprotein [uncultured Pseudomonas sp.]